MSFYSKIAATSLKLLNEYGQNVTFTRDNEASFDPATGISTPAASTTFTAYCAALDYTETEIANSTIERGDIRLLVDPTTRPEIADTCPIDSVTYRVMDVREISPAGTPVLYEAQLRK